MKKILFGILFFSILLVGYSIVSTVLVYAQETTTQLPAATAQVPTLIRELPTSTGSALVTLLVIYFGLTMYFIVNWRTKVKRDGAPTFRWGTWISDNWGKIVLYVIGTAIIYWQAGAMHPIAAFMLGFSPNAIIDWVKKEGGSTT